MQENFLDADTISDRVGSAGLAQRAGVWLADPVHAKRLGDQMSAAIGGVSGVLDDDEVAATIEELLVDKVRTVELTPVLGRALEVALAGGHEQPALDGVLMAIDRAMQDNEDLLKRRIYSESPWWVPETVDDRVLAKFTGAVHNFVQDVHQTPDHEIRREVSARLGVFAQRLQRDPELRARGEQLKADLLDHEEVRAWFRSLWGSAKGTLIEAADDPESALRVRVETSLVDFGARLCEEPELQQKVDGWLASVASYLADQATGEVAELISSTVARWDAEQTGERIELQVGRDLQFIRINGTIVGGLAGLVIHAIAQAL